MHFQKLEFIQHLESKPIKDEPIKIRVQKSSYESIYLNTLSLTHEMILHKREQLKKKLSENQIIYDDSFVQNTFLKIQIISHSINYEIVVLKIRSGPFQTNLTIYNTDQQSPMHKYDINSSGSFGNIYFFNLFGQQLAAKCIGQSNKIPFQTIIVYAIKEYFYLKIASTLKIGPALMSEQFYDLIIYKDCVQFFMEKCQKLENMAFEQTLIKDIQQSIINLHSLNLIHLDIKAENICYSNTYSKFVLIDFGLTELIKEKLGFKTLTNFKGNMVNCGQQMHQLYYTCDTGFVDLYYNDLAGWLKVQMCIINLQKDYILQQQLRLRLKFNSQQYLLNPLLLVYFYFNILKAKYCFYKKQILKLQTFINNLQVKVQQKIKYQLINNFFYEITSSDQINSFYLNFIKQNYKYDYYKVDHYILSNNNRKNISKYNELYRKIKFLQFFITQISQIKDINIACIKQSYQVRQIVFNPHKFGKSIYFYIQLFINFISYNSNIFRSTKQEKSKSIYIFYQFLILNNKQQAKIQDNRQINYAQENQILQSIFNYLLKQLSGLPINTWKEEYFIKLLQQILITGICSEQNIIMSIHNFIQNSPSIQIAIRCLINFETLFKTQKYFMHTFVIYTNITWQFHSSLIKTLEAKGLTKQQQNLIQIYKQLRALIYYHQNKRQLSIFEQKCSDINNLHVENHLIRQELKLYLCVNLHHRIGIYEFSYKFDKIYKFVQSYQLNRTKSVSFCCEIFLFHYFEAKNYEKIKIYYKLIKQIYDPNKFQALQINNQMLAINFKQKMITIQQFIQKLFTFISMRKQSSKVLNRYSLQTYLIFRYIQKHKGLILNKQLTSKLKYIAATIRIDLQKSQNLLDNIENLYQSFYIYFLAHKSQISTLGKMEKSLQNLKKKLKQQSYSRQSTYLCEIVFDMIEGQILQFKGQNVNSLKKYTSILKTNEKYIFLSFPVIKLMLFICKIITYMSFNCNQIKFENSLHILVFYTICKQLNLFSEYLIFDQNNLIFHSTLHYLYEKSLVQFLHFIKKILQIFKNEQSEQNIKNVYRQIFYLLQRKDMNKNLQLLQLSQSIINIQPINQYLCLYFSNLLKIQNCSIIFLRSLLFQIAKSVDFVPPLVKLIIMHDYYFYFQKIVINKIKKQSLRISHLKNGYQLFSVKQILSQRIKISQKLQLKFKNKYSKLKRKIIKYHKINQNLKL